MAARSYVKTSGVRGRPPKMLGVGCGGSKYQRIHDYAVPVGLYCDLYTRIHGSTADHTILVWYSQINLIAYFAFEETLCILYAAKRIK